MLEYWRPKLGKWVRYRAADGQEVRKLFLDSRCIPYILLGHSYLIALIFGVLSSGTQRSALSIRRSYRPYILIFRWPWFK